MSLGWQILSVHTSHSFTWFFLFLLLVSPTLFNNVSGDHSVKERSDLNLYCGASGKPVPSITWTRVFENGSESQVLHTGTSWKIASINQTNAGKYRCTAYNGIGSPVSHTITVKVLCKYMYYVTWNKLVSQKRITVEWVRWYTVIINYVLGWLSVYPFSCDKSTLFHNNVVISISVSSNITNYHLRIQLTN